MNNNDNGMGLEIMPIISVVLGEGRTSEEKRALCRALTEAAMAAVGVRAEQVRVVIHETPLDHYAVAGVTFAERDEAAAAERGEAAVTKCGEAVVAERDEAMRNKEAAK